jgi:DNA-binding sugar fermentation-stimulating protein
MLLSLPLAHAGPGGARRQSLAVAQRQTRAQALLFLGTGRGGTSERPTLVGINTARPNGAVAAAIERGLISALRGYGALAREVAYGERCRIDILLRSPDKPPCYVEVKNAHLMREAGLAEFPDSVTARGAKHLAELAKLVGTAPEP